MDGRIRVLQNGAGPAEMGAARSRRADKRAAGGGSGAEFEVPDSHAGERLANFKF